MPIGPRDKPSPLILHINSTTNAPAKIAEASAIYVTTVSAVTVSATNYLGLNFTGAGTPAGPDVGLIQYYANSTDFGSDPTFKFTPGTKTLSVSNVSSTNSESVVANVGVLTANTILNPVILVSTKVSAAYGNISELSSVIVSATTYKNLPTSSLSGLADVQFTNPSNGQSLVWSSTRWVASSVDSGITDHGNLVGLQDNDHPQYVLSSTNSSLSSLVASIETSTTQLSSTLASHIASAVHWNLTTLNTNYLNSSGDNSNSEFYLGTVSATTLSATNYLNLPSSTIVWSEAYTTVFVAKNGHTSTINKGTPVAITGSDGTNILVTPLSSLNTHVPDAVGFSNHVAGLAQVQMSVNATGHIVTEGLITGFDGAPTQLNTNAFNEGDILYVSSNGQLNNVRPPAPYESHPVGFVTRKNANNGEIYVKIETQPEINDIVGFNLTRETIRNGDLITYDITTSTFVNSQNINISGSVSAGVVSATQYLNLPSGTATWNASGLVGRKLSTVATPQDGQALVWHAASQHWEPSSIQTGSIGAITNNPGGSEGDIQFKYQTGFSGVDSIHYDYNLNQLHVDFISGTDIYFTNYRGLPTSSLSGQADTQITSPTAGQVLAWNASKWVASALPLNNYVLTSTNNTLSSLVSNIQTSTVNLSSTVSNLQTSTLNLSSLLGSHIASAVHWTLTTLNSNYINASGDSANASFFLQNLSGTNISATNWIGLPSAVATWNASAANGITFALTKGSNPLELLGLDAGGNTIVPFSQAVIAAALNPLLALSGVSDTNITTGNVGSGKSLVWNGSKWQPSSISAGATSLSSLLDTSVTVTPSGGQALVYSSSVNKWYPGYTIYQRNTAPDSSIGVNGDIYFQYTNTNEIIALSGLTDTEITPPITNGQSLVWNSGLNKWAPSALPLPVGSNYNFQFYKDSNLSSTSSFVWNPSDYGGSLSATVPFSSSRWAYFSETVGVGQGIILYGNGGGQTAYIKNGPAGTTAASANALITPSVSATTVSATTYLNLAPNSSNYEFEFYNNGQLSSTNKFIWNPNLYGGTVSATAPINSNIWCYFDGTLGTGQGVILYGNGGGGTGYIKNGPVGTTAVSANNFITSSVSAAIVSSTTYRNTPAEIGIACSDETTDIVSSISPSATFRMPYAMTLTEVRGNVNTSAAVSAIIVDIQHNGFTIFTTNKLRINAGEYTSKAAGTTQPTITTTSLTDDAEMKVIINQTGTTSPGKGLKIWLIGRRA